MAESGKIQMSVTVTVEEGQVNVELDPEDVIALRGDNDVNRVGITLAGEPIALLQRFAGPIPGIEGSGDNASLN